MNPSEKLPEKKSSPQKSGLKNYVKYSGIAFQMAGILLVGVFGGRKLDQYLQQDFPLFTLTLTGIAFVGAFYILYKQATSK
ncbi:MAG: hypothetical protein COA57_03610 [Flavobacteriales bacterium]|nr:MAG: hypothetical protein COA57_03610 [Flavobacteriales bacterium]